MYKVVFRTNFAFSFQNKAMSATELSNHSSQRINESSSHQSNLDSLPQAIVFQSLKHVHLCEAPGAAKQEMFVKGVKFYCPSKMSL